MCSSSPPQDGTGRSLQKRMLGPSGDMYLKYFRSSKKLGEVKKHRKKRKKGVAPPGTAVLKANDEIPLNDKIPVNDKSSVNDKSTV